MSASFPYAVVLVEPTLPENVGAVARAMNNLGVEDLRLVNPCDHLSAGAISVAAHSAEILRGASCYSSLSEAVSDCHHVVGTTARRRDRFAEPVLLPQINTQMSSEAGLTALVFGRESSGLSNDELACCQTLVQIPTYGKTASLNLAQAVVVVLYELRRHFADDLPTASGEAVTAGEMEGFKAHLFSVLKLVGFLREHQRATLWQSFSDLIARSRLTSPDLRMLRGFLRRTENRVKHLEARTKAQER